MSAQIEAANGHQQEAPKPPALSLRDLAQRLFPNPALTIEGTLEIILDGIDRIDNEALARALACANMSRQMGGEVAPIGDQQWREADIALKLRLLDAAASLKLALRMMR